MSKIYYIKDENGTYLSADGRTRYTKLQGRKLYKFLKSEEGKRRKFHVEIDEEGNWLAIESSKNRRKKSSALIGTTIIKNKRKEEFKYTILSGSAIVSYPDDDEVEFIESLTDEGINTETNAMLNLQLNKLRAALQTLSEEEYDLIHNLFLSESPMSERAYARAIGLTQQGVNKRKKQIFAKIKNYF